MRNGLCEIRTRSLNRKSRRIQIKSLRKNRHPPRPQPLRPKPRNQRTNIHHPQLVPPPTPTEPQLTSREDQLHYEILISGKAFPLNGVIPIAFKFTPLAKVRLHRIKVFLSENVEYYCRNKKVHRLEPMRKLLLFEKQAQRSGEISPAGILGRELSFLSSGQSSGVAVSGSRPPTVPNTTTSSADARGTPRRVVRPSMGRQTTTDPSAHSLLGNLEGGDGSGGSTEFEVNVPLPGCASVKAPIDMRNKNSPLIPVRFHHTTIWPNMVVHHWIKIVLRISKSDENSENKTKRRHFEISIDSPIHLLSVYSFMVAELIEVSFSSKYLSSSVYESNIHSAVRDGFRGMSMQCKS